MPESLINEEKLISFLSSFLGLIELLSSCLRFQAGREGLNVKGLV